MRAEALREHGPRARVSRVRVARGGRRHELAHGYVFVSARPTTSSTPPRRPPWEPWRRARGAPDVAERAAVARGGRGRRRADVPAVGRLPRARGEPSRTTRRDRAGVVALGRDPIGPVASFRTTTRRRPPAQHRLGEDLARDGAPHGGARRPAPLRDRRSHRVRWKRQLARRAQLTELLGAEVEPHSTIFCVTTHISAESRGPQRGFDVV